MLDVIDISQRVESGAKVLDSELPNWVNDVDLTTLNLGDPSHCVLAEAHPSNFYWDALNDLTGQGDANTAILWGIEHGFNLPDAAIDEEWDALESAWVGLITVRQSRAKAQS
jgi:hypothetical protein